MDKRIRLLLVDDHPVIRAGIAAMLGLYPEFEIVAQAATAAEAIRLHAQHHPDLTLMDVRLPGMDGIQALASIRSANDTARVIMLSSESFPADVTRAMEAGASGYLLKTLPHSEFARELRHAHQHGWCQPFTPGARRPIQEHIPRLTSREVEVLHCLRRGLSNADIGTALEISPETAITHVKSLLTKLQAANRTEAVSMAYKLGLLKTYDDLL